MIIIFYSEYSLIRGEREKKNVSRQIFTTQLKHVLYISRALCGHIFIHARSNSCQSDRTGVIISVHTSGGNLFLHIFLLLLCSHSGDMMKYELFSCGHPIWKKIWWGWQTTFRNWKLITNQPKLMFHGDVVIMIITSARSGQGLSSLFFK